MNNDFLQTIITAQIASALVLIATFLAIIAFLLTVRKKLPNTVNKLNFTFF